MAIIFTENVSADKERIVTIYYNEHNLNEDQRKNGVIVEHIPEPETIEGKHHIAFLKPSTNEIYYEYVDAPPTKEQELETLRQQQQIMQAALDDIIMGGMM